MKTTNKEITEIPHRLECFGSIGWTVRRFANATDAAAWFVAHPQAAMPCWRRMDIVDGKLLLVR